MGHSQDHRSITAPPRKRFGQNFLHDRNIIENIIHAINPSPSDHILEIGPGHGALTYPLLERVKHLHVIEIDRDLITALRLSHAYANHHLSIYEGDALKLDLHAIVTRISGKSEEPIRLIGNLPYNISTPLLFRFVDIIDHIKDAHFMLQREVVERMAATPNSKTYGRLSVMLQAQFHIEAQFVVPPGAFHPPPKVQSQIVRLTPLPRAERQILPPHFAQLVSQAFSARRKTLRKALKGLVNERGFAQSGVNPTDRPENLSVSQYIELSRNTVE